MRAYTGQTRGGSLVRQLRAAGIGECVTRGELPPRRTPWFHDCGAFADWMNGRAFDYVRWTRDLRYMRQRIEAGKLAPPDFVVLPDRVAAGLDSLTFSLDHVTEARDAVAAPLYLAVQDGMPPSHVRRAVERHQLGGLFVGGSLVWKLRTLHQWTHDAHRIGIKCHVGRVGTRDRVAHCAAAGVDSIDSSLPLWSTHHLADFVRALDGAAPHLPLFEAHP